MIAPVVMAQIWKHSLVKCQIDAIDFDRQLDVLIDLILNGVASSEERAPEKRGIA
jgi:hypothetical protein